MAAFYILVVILYLQSRFFNFKNRNHKIQYLLLSFIELQILSGIRVPLYGDSEYYTELFVEITKTPFRDIFDIGLEKGFLFFCYLTSLISSRPQALIFCSSFIMNALFLYFIYKKSRIVWLSVIFYVTFLFFFNTMNLIRFMMASSILLLANDYIVERKPIRFFIILAVAASLHFSTLIYSILYFVYPMTLNKKNILAITIPFYLFSIAFMSVFQLLIQVNDRYVSYGASGEFYQSAFANILEFFISLLIFGFAYYYKRKVLKVLFGDGKLYSWMLFIAMIFAFMSINVMMIIRFVSLYSIALIVFIPNIISEMKLVARRRWIVIFLSFSVLRMAVVLTYRPEWFFGEPYRNWLF